MGEILALPTSDAQRALARFREEERAFGVVLDVLAEWRNDELFARVFTLYRTRMRCLRRLAGSLLDGAQPASAAEELRRFALERGLWARLRARRAPGAAGPQPVQRTKPRSGPRCP